ncbi:HNH endonuclease family protein [Stomatohabitans albus]
MMLRLVVGGVIAAAAAFGWGEIDNLGFKPTSPQETPQLASEPARSRGYHADTSIVDSRDDASQSDEIRALLGTLKVAPKERGQRYHRDAFGDGWTDIDHNTCYTRNDILRRDLHDTKQKGRCKIISGTLDDPYTGMRIHYVAGPNTTDDVQIDHVVALKDAWGTGAQHMSAEQRIAFSNDPLNLLAVDGETNDDKGHQNAAEWLPPNAGFHCHYIARQIAVKARHGLWVTQSEHDAMATVLHDCPPAMRVSGDTVINADE